MEAMEHLVGAFDVHKRDVVCHVLGIFLDEEKKIVAKTLAVRRFSRSLDGLGELAEFLREMGVKIVVMETTGHYCLKVYSFMEAEGFDAWLVPARDNKPSGGKKTDETDAERLARRFVAGAVRAYKLPSDRKIRALRRYVRTRKAMVEDLATWKNRVIRIFDEACIDIKGVFSSLGKGALVFLEGYVAGKDLDSIIERWPRLAKKKDKLLAIMRTRLDEASIASLRSALRVIRVLMREIEALDRRIENILVEFGRDVELLLTVPGVGLKSCAVILAEIANIRRFSSAKKLASYAGLVPTVYKSGDKIVYGRLRSECNKRLRWILYEVALNAIKVSPWLRSFYERLVRRGKAKKQALIAVARKIAVGIWHILTKRVPWKEAIRRNVRMPRKRRVAGLTVREAMRVLREAGYIVMRSQGRS